MTAKYYLSISIFQKSLPLAMQSGIKMHAYMIIMIMIHAKSCIFVIVSNLD